MIRSTTLVFAVCSLLAGLCPAQAGSAAAQPSAEAVATPLSAVEGGGPAVGVETFLQSLGVPEPQPAAPGDPVCAYGSCNRPKDCFAQGWNVYCRSVETFTAAWCFGYPNVTNCEGYCGCN